MNLLSVGIVPAATLALLLASCAPPKGEQTRRVETNDTTRAERQSAEIQPAALAEFSDQVAQQLTADLIALPEFNQGGRVNVVFGDISNRTGIVSTTDFEAFRVRVRQKLINSPVARTRIRWIESRAKMEELRQRESVGQPGGADLLAPERTFFLNGEMFRVVRQPDQVNLYMLSFKLTNAQSLEIVWENVPYEVKQTPGS